MKAIESNASLPVMLTAKPNLCHWKHCNSDGRNSDVIALSVFCCCDSVVSCRRCHSAFHTEKAPSTIIRFFRVWSSIQTDVRAPGAVTVQSSIWQYCGCHSTVDSYQCDIGTKNSVTLSPLSTSVILMQTAVWHYRSSPPLNGQHCRLPLPLPQWNWCQHWAAWQWPPKQRDTSFTHFCLWVSTVTHRGNE